MGKFKVQWNGTGGEIYSQVVEGNEYDGCITKAIVAMLEGQTVTPGDSIIVTAVD